MARLQREGIVTHVGVSNYSLAGWQTAERLLGGPVLSNQVQYSLVDRRPEKELLGWAQQNDRLIIAYSPLAQGLLSGAYSVDEAPGGHAGHAAALPSQEPGSGPGPARRPARRGRARTAPRRPRWRWRG